MNHGINSLNLWKKKRSSKEIEEITKNINKTNYILLEKDNGWETIDCPNENRYTKKHRQNNTLIPIPLPIKKVRIISDHRFIIYEDYSCHIIDPWGQQYLLDSICSSEHPYEYISINDTFLTITLKNCGARSLYTFAPNNEGKYSPEIPCGPTAILLEPICKAERLRCKSYKSLEIKDNFLIIDNYGKKKIFNLKDNNKELPLNDYLKLQELFNTKSEELPEDTKERNTFIFDELPQMEEETKNRVKINLDTGTKKHSITTYGIPKLFFEM